MTAAVVTQVNTYKDISSSVKTGTNHSANNNFSKVFQKNVSQDTKESDQKVQSKNDETKSKVEDLKSDYKSENTKETENLEKAETSEKPENIEKKDSMNDETVTDENTDIDKLIDEANKKADVILLAIQNILNIPLDQITTTIDKLDMQPTDLLDATNISKLVLALTEGTDEITLMTDEKLFTQVKELMAQSDKQLTNLADDLGITIEEIKNKLCMGQMPQNEITNTDVLPVNVDNNQKSNQTLNQEQVSDKVNNNDSVMIKTEERPNKQGTQNEHSGTQDFSFSQSIMQQLKDAVSKIQDTKPISYASESESIMEQINEMLKVTMKDDMTEMEMQLHPASLGNVRVQVASKDGMITASFTTQNETVKAALESQIVTLKENLNEQGIKVEAVEVTVASHAFERNLNEEGEQPSGQMQEKKKSIRKINLAELSEESEEGLLEQQDRIVADMMRKNGNTVDYTA